MSDEPLLQSMLANVLPQWEHHATTPSFSKYMIHGYCKSVFYGCCESLLFMGYNEFLMFQFVKSSRVVNVLQRNASKPIKASVNGSSQQPSILTLENLGIKVRDFTYESKLLPIQTIYCHPRQIQPAVVRATLKHQQDDDPFSQPSSHPETSQKRLERTSTEPVIPPTPNSTDIDGGNFSQSSSQRETSQKKLPMERTSSSLHCTSNSIDTYSQFYRHWLGLRQLFFSVEFTTRNSPKKLERTSTKPVLIPPTPNSTELIWRTISMTRSQILKKPTIPNQMIQVLTNPTLIDSESQTIQVNRDQLEEVICLFTSVCYIFLNSFFRVS